MGRPSIDPEVLLRPLLVGYLYGITSERRLLDEVRMHLAYRWFTRLGFEQEIPDHSTFSKNRHGRFRQCSVFRKLFEEVVRRCLEVGLVDGRNLAVDGTLVGGNASNQSRVPREKLIEVAPISRTVQEYRRKVILSVDATPARFRQEMLAARRMLERVGRFGVRPQNLAADKAYGSGEFLAWLLERDIQPHNPVIDRQHQTRGRFTRDVFRYEPKENAYYCPEGKPLHYRGQRRTRQGDLYRSTEAQCHVCPQKKLCTRGSYRRLFVHWQEPARQAVRALAGTPVGNRSRHTPAPLSSSVY